MPHELHRGLWIFGVVQAVAILGFAWLAQKGANQWLLQHFPKSDVDGFLFETVLKGDYDLALYLAPLVPASPWAVELTQARRLFVRTTAAALA